MEEEVDAGLHKANLLDVETDKCRTAEPGGGQEQQSPIAQAGQDRQGKLSPMRVRWATAGGSARRRVAVRRTCRSSVVTAWSDAGDAKPCWRC